MRQNCFSFAKSAESRIKNTAIEYFCEKKGLWPLNNFITSQTCFGLRGNYDK